MPIETLLTAALEKAADLLIDAGLSGAKDLKDQLLHTDEKKRRQALEAAWQAAATAVKDDDLHSLTKHRPFQEEVIRALLDPSAPFDPQGAAQAWGEALPEQRKALQTFFRKLHDALLRDDLWGPVLMRFQDLRDEPAAQPLVIDRAWISQISAQLTDDGTIVQGDGNTVVGAQGRVAQGAAQQVNLGNVNGMQGGTLNAAGNNVVYGDNITYNIQQPGGPPPQPPIDPRTARQRYLDCLIECHRSLRLQAIRSGSQPLSVDLEQVYVSLSALEKGGAASDVGREGDLSLPAALQRRQRWVLIGDPGSGKTTLLAYLALTYARTLQGGADLVKARLGLDETGRLPVALPLRDLARSLKDERPQADGPAVLLRHLQDYYAAQVIDLPLDFFTRPLEDGQAVLLLDGLDEVAEPALRQRVARLIEAFAGRYPKNRYVVTSRKVGYEDAARIAADFALAEVRPFNPEQVRQFVHDWTRTVEIALAGKISDELLRKADAQSERLIKAIENNPRVADLAVNPLLLTVIALVHRYRAQLPERRSELYEEAVEVLLGYWDEAKGLDTQVTVGGRSLDAGDRRSLLEPVAFWMQEHKQREIERDDLRTLLLPSFQGFSGSAPSAGRKACDAFLRMIGERSGLLVERGVGMYGFAHLTFQEYLAARALADRQDAQEYTLKVLSDPWWREVVLLEAGYLSSQGKRRVSALIRAIIEAQTKSEGEPFHHLLLAAECLFDVGEVRVEAGLLDQVRERLRVEADRPFEKGKRTLILRKVSAANALSRIESGQVVPKFWKLPWGEPEWVTAPDGEFWMGSDDGRDDEKPLHRLFLPAYQIARVPVTNAQYALYIQDSRAKPPGDWRAGQPPPGKDDHPVVNVSWDDANAYCRWLAEKIGREARLPSEAEWEKAARGDHRDWRYPWGPDWRELHCNSNELGLGAATPVGLFLNGASPYGVLDMSGNVWEWVNDWYDADYYSVSPASNPPGPTSGQYRVLRGGAWYGT